MRRLPTLLALVLLSTMAACASVPPRSMLGDEAAPTERLVLTHDGVERTAFVFAPDEVAPGAPLVLALHGAVGSGERFSDVRRRLTAEANRRGWVIAFPTGTACLRGRGACWDDRDAPRAIARADADDVGYLRALVEALQERHGIDTERVLVTGFSNGGGMAYRFAAEAPDLVAAAVAVGGTVGRTQGRTDYSYAMVPTPTAPVPMLIVRGMDDDLIPYHGGVRPNGTFQVLAAEYDANFWAEANGCDIAAVEKDGTSFLRDARTDGTETYDYRAGCRDGATVRLVGVGGLGHAWPTARDGYDATGELVAFFERATRN
ncbi:MAG: PHB depolymerase family esterase [Bacteroidota bacterium]